MSSLAAGFLNVLRPAPEPPELRAQRQKTVTMFVIWVAIAFGVVAIVAYAFAAIPATGDALRASARTACMGVLLAGGALLAGSLLGFLFGMPRTLQAAGDGSAQLSYQVNTNLEQISDWLTKIIVGVTLVELGKIPPYFMSLSDYVAPAIGGGDASTAFAGTIMVYFAVAGFFFGYLGTRLYLTLAIAHSDRTLVLDTVARIVTDAENEKAPPKPPGSDPSLAGRAPDAPAPTPAVAAVQKMVEEQRPSPGTTTPAAARGIALSLAAAGKYDAALPFFERANVDPTKEPNVAMQYAAALGETGDYEGAVEVLERMVKARQGLPTIYQWLGFYLLWIPERQLDAVKYTQQYLAAIGREDGGAIFNLACAYAELYKQDPEKAHYRDLAVAELKRAVAINKQWATRALELRALGDDFAALSDAEIEGATRVNA